MFSVLCNGGAVYMYIYLPLLDLGHQRLCCTGAPCDSVIVFGLDGYHADRAARPVINFNINFDLEFSRINDVISVQNLMNPLIKSLVKKSMGQIAAIFFRILKTQMLE
jgi:hypothetical protein